MEFEHHDPDIYACSAIQPKDLRDLREDYFNDGVCRVHCDSFKNAENDNLAPERRRIQGDNKNDR